MDLGRDKPSAPNRWLTFVGRADFLDNKTRRRCTHSVPNALSQEYLMHCFAGERPDNKAEPGSVQPVSTDSPPHCWMPCSLGVAVHYQPSSKALSGKCGTGASTSCPRRSTHPNETGLLILQKPHGFLFPKTHFGAFKDDKSSARELSRPFLQPLFSFLTLYIIHNAGTYVPLIWRR